MSFISINKLNNQSLPGKNMMTCSDKMIRPNIVPYMDNGLCFSKRGSYLNGFQIKWLCMSMHSKIKRNVFSKENEL